MKDFIYLIVGDTISDYDSTIPWNVIGFYDEEKANKHCSMMNERVKEIFRARDRDPLWGQHKDSPEFRFEFDETFFLGESTTFYEVHKIEIL